MLKSYQKKTLARYADLIKDQHTWTKTEITSFATLIRSLRWIREVTEREEIIADLYSKFQDEIRSNPKSITQEQTSFGIDWLKRTCLTSRSEIRNNELIRNSGLTGIDREIILNFSHFQFLGYETRLGYNFTLDILAPAYRVVAHNGRSFDYTFTGGYQGGNLLIDHLNLNQDLYLRLDR